jgi:hypothetical protein
MDDEEFGEFEYVYDDDDEDEAVAGPGLKEAFGLPDELPPMRLPGMAQLADMARRSPVVAQLVALADWAGEDGRLVDEEEELPDPAVAEGASVLGVSTDEFRYLWEIAYTADWIDLEEDEDGELRMYPASTAEQWDEGTADDVLACWDATLEAVLAEALPLAGEPDPASGLDLEGRGFVLAIFLFLFRQDGLLLSEARELIRDTVVGEDPAPALMLEWAEWVSCYGEPADVILRRSAELGAVIMPDSPDEPVRLTPLALWALREQVLLEGIGVPLLPSPEEMSAVELLAVAASATEEEFDTETDGWLASRDPLTAAREVLSLATVGEAADRVLAAGVVSRIGADAVPAWQSMLEVPEMAPYARVAMAGLAADGTLVNGSDFGLSLEDVAWLTTDVLAIACDEEADPAEIAEQLAAAVPEGNEALVFDMISRGPHPDAVDVLEMLGSYHPDKKIAKQARTFAYKAASRRSAAGD